MITPANYHLTVTLPVGKTARGRIVYLQSKEDRWRDTRQLLVVINNAEGEMASDCRLSILLGRLNE